ncbi:MAG: hypothetical protein CMJ18_04405 [Phycisphaeraceae bacterium]|nr:hypothetical protein [Phycisphaeraceae bacterium]
MNHHLFTAAILLAAALAGPGRAEDAAAPAAAGTAPSDSAAAVGSEGPQLNDLRSRYSYIVGLRTAATIMQNKLDGDLVIRGIRDQLAQGKLLLTQEQMRETIQIVQQEQVKRFRAESEKNLKEARTFLDANRSKEGVQELADGLQYKVLVEGEGPKPTIDDWVQVHYRGRLLNGAVFDTSYRGEQPTVEEQPRVLPLRRLIPGWSQALQQMSAGSKWQLFIAPNLAYGPNGQPPRIGPNAALLFEVELVGIAPPPAPKPQE